MLVPWVIVGAAIKILNRLHLARRETVVPIHTCRTHSLSLVHDRVEGTAGRVINDAVADSIEGVALSATTASRRISHFVRLSGTPSPLVENAQDSRQNCRQKSTSLRHPHMSNVEPLIIEHWRACNDAIKVVVDTVALPSGLVGRSSNNPRSTYRLADGHSKSGLRTSTRLRLDGQ